MQASCLCGAVRVSLARKPEYINDCNCSLCRRAGGAWGYYSNQDVNISGETSYFLRSDIENPAVAAHFCPSCGTSTHWALSEAYQRANPGLDRVGVNMKLFAPKDLIGIEIRFPDGDGWTGKRPPGVRREPVLMTASTDW